MSGTVEIRYAFRVLNRTRAYTAVAALTLALSIGANTAIFSMADAIVNRPFAFPDLRRVAALSATIPRASSERYAVSPADYFDWVEQNRVFARMAAYQPWSARLTGPRDSQNVRAYLVAPGFFSLLGIPPLKGRVFAGGMKENERNAIIVGYGFWQQRLASDPAAVGKSINLNGVGHTIIGVMPKRFDFPTYTEIWAPWITTPEQAKAERAVGTLSVIGRLKPGVSLAQARAQLSNVGADLARKYPATNAGCGVNVMRLGDSADPYAIRYMTVISAAVGLLLVLACANVANLQLARCAMRRREMALRVALGARRSQIARQLFMEGILLSLAGAGLGLPLAAQALTLIRNSIPPLVSRHLPGLPYAALDARVLFWMAIAAVVTGIAFTVPAVLQISTGRVQETLREGGRGLVGSGGRRIRSALVVSEIAFALVLLAGAALLFRTFRNLTPASQGFDPANVLTFTLRAPDGQVGNFFEERLRRVRELPEIASAAAISELPALADSRSGSALIEGQPAPPPDSPLLAELRIASEDYFRTMSIRIVRGRAFTRHDGVDGLRIAVIGRTAARRFWGRQDPLGRRLELVVGGRRSGLLTVVGIAADVNHFFLDSDIRPTVYVPYLQYPVRVLHVLVKPVAGAQQAASAVREVMRSLDQSPSAYTLESLGRLFADLSGGVGLLAALIAVFALLSLVLSAAGVFAVMHYSVVQRTQEIGIRMAVGARSTDVWKMVLGDSLRLAGIALSVGLPAAWALSRGMSKMLAGIVVLEPLMLAGAAMLVAGAAVLAACVPARKATRVDPLVAIRSQ